jgi:steroid delta-isomerase-like uncharacterized protein
MSTEDHKLLVRRFFSAFETNDQATLKALLAPELEAYLPGDAEPVNLHTFLDIVQKWEVAFSDLHFGIECLIAEQDVVATRLTVEGVHNRGDFLDLPPRGKPFAITVMTTERIAEGRIVERRVVFNLSDLLRQLGTTVAPR